MPEVSCKQCGERMKVQEGAVLAECEVCGGVQTVPCTDCQDLYRLYSRGHRLRQAGEFEKAAKVFRSMAEQDPEEPEAFWGQVLCRYGITWEEDPDSGNMRMVCALPSEKSILDDENYDQTMELARREAGKCYRAEAKEMERLRRISASVPSSPQTRPVSADIPAETDWDVALAGNWTGGEACKLKAALKERGYRIAAPGEGRASETAPVLLVLGAAPEDFEAPETAQVWSAFRKRDRKQTKLIPCRLGLDSWDLPPELEELPGQDLKVPEADRILSDAIERFLVRIGRREGIAEEAPALQSDAVPAKEAPPKWARILSDGLWDLEREKPALAENAFREILKEYGECPEALLGMMLVCEEEELPQLLRRFQSSAPREMSSLERTMFLPRTQKKLLRRYAALKDTGRVRESLKFYVGTITIPTSLAMLRKDPDLLPLLLEHGLNLAAVKREKYDSGNTADRSILDYCVAKGFDRELIEGMLEAGADPNGTRVLHEENGDSTYTTLSEAVRVTGNVDIARLLMAHGADASGRDLVHFKNGNYGEKPMLSEAILKNRPEMVRALLDGGADVNAVRLLRTPKGDSYYTALSDAISQAGNPDLVRILLERGAEVSAQNRISYDNGTCGEEPPLYTAITKGSLEMVGLLLEYGADVNGVRLLRDSDGDCLITLLSDCVAKIDNSDMTRMLLQHGADWRLTDRLWNDGLYVEGTPLWHAVRFGNLEQAKLLLEHGADPNETILKRRFSNGNPLDSQSTMLWSSIDKEVPVEMVRLLLEYGARADQTERIVEREGACNLVPALTVAVWVQSREAACFLLDHGADPNSAEQRQETWGETVIPALYEAVKRKYQDLVELLLERGADPNVQETRAIEGNKKEREKPIHQAVWDNSVSLVRLLLDHGADPNPVRSWIDQDGETRRTPLQDSLWRGTGLEMPRLLLEQGADPNLYGLSQMDDGAWEETALQMAIRRKDLEQARLLLDHGADPDLPSRHLRPDGTSLWLPLEMAIRHGENREMVRLLLDRGASVNALSKIFFDEGIYAEYTPLHEAIFSKNEELERLLLEQGADPNCTRLRRTKLGDSTIHILTDSMTKTGSESMVEALLKKGADPSQVDDEILDNGTRTQHCPLFHAFQTMKSVSLVKLLLRYGASLKDMATWNGKQIPLMRYPFELNITLMNVLKANGWKGPGLFNRLW